LIGVSYDRPSPAQQAVVTRLTSQTKRGVSPKYLLMKSVPGTLQEGGASFQTTHWTVVLQAGQSDGPESSQQALAEFCESYWPPLYAFLRHRRYSSADAQDLMQGSSSICWPRMR
jgi:hypothetical protein